MPADEPGGLVTVELESGASLQARARWSLSTGARWRQMGVPGEAEYRNKGVTYCPHCDGPLFKGKRVAVIGGGNSGVEAAIDLAGVVAHVTLIEFDDALRADEVLQRKLRSLPNVDVIVSARTTEVVGDGEQGHRPRPTRTATTGEVHTARPRRRVRADRPAAQHRVARRHRRAVAARRGRDRRRAATRRSPGVFAAGDCTTVPYKQIVIAMGAGSTAALSAFDHLIRTSAPAAEVGAVAVASA